MPLLPKVYVIYFPQSPLTNLIHLYRYNVLLTRTMQQLDEFLRLHFYIQEVEKQISSELKVFTEMKIFPSQEILLIKKDMKAYKEKFMCVKLKQRERSGETDNSSKEEEAKNVLSYQSDDRDTEENRELSKTEQLVSERKLYLFTERRRAEEEFRIIHARKVAKARAALELQSKDPSNFMNQKKYQH